MTLWSEGDLLAATSGRFTRPFSASGVSIDTRTLRPGDLFVALADVRDGHAFLADALARGAAGALVRNEASAPAGASLLVVPDTLEALWGLGRHARARFRGRVVAVTGSVGKTTTKEMLRLALSPFGTVHAAQNSYNNHWGVPLTLALAPADADFLVAEIGMNRPGEIAPLSRLARPHVAVVTTVAPVHIGHLGSLEAIADEKAAVGEGLEPGGTLVLPGTSPLVDRMSRERPAALFFPDDGIDVQAPGAHMRHNAAAALAGVDALGLSRAAAANTLAEFRAIGGRGAQRRIAGFTLLDESYNASSVSVRAALDVLRTIAEAGGGRRLAVLGDMLELGEWGPAEHRGLRDDVVAGADVLYACGPLMRGLFDAVPPPLRGAHASDSAALAPVVAEAVRPGDVVLVKGSLGSRMRLVVQALEACA